MHFFKRNQALIIKSNIKYKNDSYITLISNDNSYNDQAHVIIEMIGLIINAAYFVIKKTSFNINEISYIAY
jgi:hypothetical protein